MICNSVHTQISVNFDMIKTANINLFFYSLFFMVILLDPSELAGLA